MNMLQNTINSCKVYLISIHSEHKIRMKNFIRALMMISFSFTYIMNIFKDKSMSIKVQLQAS
jgi:hypothetical protein